ncbi:restriction endonuclease subunit S [Empedobacter falsenii]
MSHSGFTDTFNKKGNIITISEGGNSCGFTNFITEDFWLGGHCYALEDLVNNIYNIYLYQYLKFIESKIMKLRVGSGLPNIQKKDLSKLIIILPTIEEQTKIANFLSAVDKQIEAIENQITKTETYKKGLLQQMFV